MDAEELRATHAKIHAELGNAGQLDPESRRILAEIMQDISRLIAVPPQQTPLAAPAASPAPSPAPGAVDRLEAVAVQFEAGHPALAANIRRLVDLLSKAGV
jgi:hypothetical protein